MCAWTARLIRNAPLRCTPSTVSQSSSVILKSRLSRITPALFTSTTGGPSSAATRSTAALTCSALDDVGADRDGPAAARGDLLDGVLAGRLVEVEDGDGEAVPGELDRGGRADATGRAGHDGDAADRSLEVVSVIPPILPGTGRPRKGTRECTNFGEIPDRVSFRCREVAPMSRPTANVEGLSDDQAGSHYRRRRRLRLARSGPRPRTRPSPPRPSPTSAAARSTSPPAAPRPGSPRTRSTAGRGSRRTGTGIAYVHNNTIWVMNADGSAKRQVSDRSAGGPVMVARRRLDRFLGAVLHRRPRRLPGVQHPRSPRRPRCSSRPSCRDQPLPEVATISSDRSRPRGPGAP